MEPPLAEASSASASAIRSVSSSAFGLGGFLLLNAGLAAASFLAFLCPSRLRLEDRNMAVVNALGAGVLVGCVLGIILPEGFAAACQSPYAGGALLGGYILQVLLDVAGRRLSGGGAAGGGHHHHYHHLAKQSPRPNGEGDTAGAEAAVVEVVECLGDEEDEEDEEDGGAHDLEIELPPMSPTAGGVGAAGGGGGRVTVRSPHRLHSTADSGGSLLLAAGATHYPRSSSSSSHYPRRPAVARSGARCARCCPFSSDFLGLLVHCLADGVALGASSLSSSAALRWAVFGALTLHKLPVAFATGAFVHASLSPSSSTSRGPWGGIFLLHALVFALASPLSAIITHGAAGLLTGGDGANKEAEAGAIGALLLFSGGSFAYVALGHIAPEVLHSPLVRRPGPRAWLFLGVLLFGMGLVPLLAALVPEGEEGEWHGH